MHSNIQNQGRLELVVFIYGLILYYGVDKLSNSENQTNSENNYFWLLSAIVGTYITVIKENHATWNNPSGLTPAR